MLTKMDNQGRVKIPKLIWPYFRKPIDVAIFYSPQEDAIGIVPPNKSWDGYRVLNVRNVDYEGRINVGRYLETLKEKKERNVLVYSLDGIIYIKAM